LTKGCTPLLQKGCTPLLTKGCTAATNCKRMHASDFEIEMHEHVCAVTQLLADDDKMKLFESASAPSQVGTPHPKA